MKAFQNVDGGVIQSVRTYDIAPTTAILAGQVVKLTNGLVVAAAAGETGEILGIAAEHHSGSEDAINPRANGKEITVYDAPGMVMQCRAPKLTATGGTATTITAEGLANAALTGGFVRLVQKGDESENTEAVGTVRKITAAAAGTLTVEEGGTPSAGDVYEVYPPIGFQGGNLSADGTALVLSATAEISLKVVQNAREGYIGLLATKHFLAN